MTCSHSGLTTNLDNTSLSCYSLLASQLYTALNFLLPEQSLKLYGNLSAASSYSNLTIVFCLYKFCDNWENHQTTEPRIPKQG